MTSRVAPEGGRTAGNSGPLQVIRAGTDAGTAWDAFVEAAPDSQFPHRWGWRSIVEDVQGHEYIPLVAVDDGGAWLGILPLVRMKTPLLGHVLISMPFLNYGGPVGSPAAVRALTDAAVALAVAEGAGEVQLRSRSAPDELHTPAIKILVTLSLEGGEDAVWKRFSAKLRSQIRRPQKEGMAFMTGADQLDAFYEVFAHNMRDLGTPVYGKTFFHAIRNVFPDVTFGAVYLDGKPIAAGCGFTWRDEFEITWASTIRAYNRLSPNMLLYWGFMQAVMQKSVHTFNFGRSTPDTGPHRFKMQWGGEERSLQWTAWHAHPSSHDDGGSRFKSIASEAWKRLPLWAANRIGPVIAPRLPWW